MGEGGGGRGWEGVRVDVNQELKSGGGGCEPRIEVIVKMQKKKVVGGEGW